MCIYCSVLSGVSNCDVANMIKKASWPRIISFAQQNAVDLHSVGRVP